MGPDNLAYGMEDVDQYVQVFDSPIENLSRFTMTGWIKSDTPQAARTGLFGQNDSIEFGLNPGDQMNVWFPNTGALSYTLPDGEFLDEAWYHVGLVGTGQNVQFYVNGEQVAVGGSALPGSAGYGASTYTFNIGGGGIFDATGNQFTGTVDEIAMWDVALTDVQIQSMWDAANQAGGNFTDAVLATNPLGYWPLNETSGTVAANAGVAGEDLVGTYYSGNQGVDGPDFPGMGEDNLALEVGPDDPSYVGVDARPLNNRTEFSIGGWVKYEET